MEETSFIGHPLGTLWLSNTLLSSAPSLKHIRNSLRDLFVTEANIEVLDKDYFYDCCCLEIVDFSSNKITQFPDFRYITSTLYSCYFMDNQLEQIDSLYVVAFPKLEMLSVASNQISFFNVTWLSTMPLFRLVKLQDNNLTQLADPREFITGDRKLRVRLRDNPWHCGGSIEWLLNEWQRMTPPAIDKVQIDDIVNMTCHTPLSAHGMYIIEIGKGCHYLSSNL